MKKIAIVLMALACAGCHGYPRTGDGGKSYNPVVYADTETGCEYLTTPNVNALTARIDSDGKTHRGCKNGGQK